MAPTSNKKGSVKDQVDGNELDLSLNNLSVVPVKELIPLTKVTHLDLSCNQLQSLPDEFCQLNQLVKLDLSRNQIQELPRGFGKLSRLQHLDLSDNQLASIPVSFVHLNALKWLDLKDNLGLSEGLRKAAGDCLDEKQCKIAADRVIQYMKLVQSELERKRQAELTQQRAKEARKQEEERKKQRAEDEKRREEKKQVKERRRREYEEKQRGQALAKEQLNTEGGSDSPVKASKKSKYKKQQSSSSSGGCLMFLGVVVLVIAVFLGAFIYCNEAGISRRGEHEFVANYCNQSNSLLDAVLPPGGRAQLTGSAAAWRRFTLETCTAAALKAKQVVASIQNSTSTMMQSLK